MPFPSRGCRTCKQRRVKCDELRPVCNRCEKAKLVCDTVDDHGGFLFLNENEYAVGRKRPRGPNVNSKATKGRARRLPRPAYEISLGQASKSESQILPLSTNLSVLIEDQALTYYSRHYVEAPEALSGIMDGHLQCAVIDGCYSQPQSVLSLSIFAVSHATFGRARKSQDALALGSTKYSRALAKTNMALRDPVQAIDDEVVLAVMLLSYYENSVTEKKSEPSGLIQAVASRSFAHHDGAMAVLNLRRKQKDRTDYSRELDRLVRRQLLRSILLRSMHVPSWLRDGSQFGEQGFVLDFDRYMVRAAELRHQSSVIQVTTIADSFPARFTRKVKLRSLFAEAQALDEDLVIWANNRPSEDRYSTYIVTDEEPPENRTFDGTAHVYPTVGHAGMWNRYRAIRLAVNEVILKTLSALEDPDTNAAAESARLKTTLLADDLCASVPFMLGMVEVTGQDVAIVKKAPTSLKFAVKASTASFLCWPLAMATMMSGLSCLQQYYLRSRLVDVSDIVDDGMLERLAEGTPKVSHGSEHNIGV